MRTTQRSGVAALLLAAAVLLGASACGSEDDANEQEPTPTSSEAAGVDFMGARIRPPMPKPDFILTDTSGEDFDIVEETKGFVTLLYLGYTNCPDICPTHMLDISKALEEMDPADVEQVKVIFVTTDPERDTPEVIRKWLDLFNPEFIGLTADQETLDQFQISMGMTPARGATTDRSGPGGYEVSHAAYVLAFGKDDIANLAYPFGMEREAWINDIPKLVREGYKES